MSLKTEDVKAGDAVECIDIAEFSKIWRESQGYDINKMEGISLLEIGPYYFRLKGKFLIGNMGFDEIRASLDCLKYFKKKEQSQYTFDDLIDAAKKAVRDRVLQSFTFGRDLKDLDLISVVSIDNQKHIFNYQSTESGIKYIQSLYKETFVIESHEDILRCKVGAAIALSNGNRDQVYAVDNNYKCLQLSKNRTWGAIGLFFLKGTTVEQERGRDD